MHNETVSTPVDVNVVFDALELWIKQKPGLDPANYGLHPEQKRYSTREQINDAMRAFRSELRSISNDRRRALKALEEARNLAPARPDVLMEAFSAFSGRLKWTALDVNGDQQFPAPRLMYTTGQYWPTEYRKAAAAVLERYVANWLQAEARDNPPVFTYRTMDDVIAANRSIGNHWFDADTMRFFKTRVESGAIPLHSEGCHKARFITSEKGPDGVRRYSVREAQPDGTIDTVGDFQAYRTREQARANLLK